MFSLQTIHTMWHLRLSLLAFICWSLPKPEMSGGSNGFRK